MKQNLLFLDADKSIEDSKSADLLKKLSVIEKLLVKYRHFSPVNRNPYEGTKDLLHRCNCDRFYTDFNFVKFGLATSSKLLFSNNQICIKCGNLENENLKVIIMEFLRQKSFDGATDVRFLYFEAYLGMYFSSNERFFDTSITNAMVSDDIYIIYLPKPLIKNREFNSILMILLRNRKYNNLPTILIVDDSIASEYYKDEILYFSVEEIKKEGYVSLDSLMSVLSAEKISNADVANLMITKFTETLTNDK